MQERVLIVCALAAVLLLVAGATRLRVRRRTDRARAAALPLEIQRLLPPKGAAILYFHGPHCAACVQQARVLEALASQLGVRIVPLDAARDAHSAGHFGVLTVPATVVVDRTHRVHAINLGFRARADLAAQVDTAAAAS